MQRPEWVEAEPKAMKDKYFVSIVVGPYTTREECDEKLPEALQGAIDRYVEASIGDEAVGTVRLPEDFLRREIVKEKWEEVRQYSVGSMVRLHARLQFDRKAKDMIAEKYRETVVAGRLWTVGELAAGGLALMAAVFWYLKATATRDRALPC